MLKELEFASQFFLLGTTYKEPSRKYKAQTTQSDIHGRYEQEYVAQQWVNQEDYLGRHQYSPDGLEFVEALIQFEQLNAE